VRRRRRRRVREDRSKLTPEVRRWIEQSTPIRSNDAAPAIDGDRARIRKRSDLG
jgi:hypothetical protein